MTTVSRTASILAGLLALALLSPAEAQQRRERDREQQAERMQQRRQQERGQRMRQDRQRARQTQLRGRVQATRKVRVKRTGEQALLVVLATQEGRRVMVDLGPADELQDVRIREGARIAVQGRLLRVNGRPILFAQQLRANDQRVRIERPLPTRRQGDRRQGDRRREGREERGRDRRQGARDSAEDQQEPRRLTVIATDYDFEPHQIRAEPGRKLRVTLVNRGSVIHNIEFELPQGEVMFDEPVPPGERKTLTFTTPQETGSYVYYCPIRNHRARGMEGKLIVRRQQGGSE